MGFREGSERDSISVFVEEVKELVGEEVILMVDVCTSTTSSFFSNSNTNPSFLGGNLF